MDNLKRRPAAPARPAFPDPVYSEMVLAPTSRRAWEALGTSVLEALSAHVVVLAEARVIPRERAGAVLAALADVPDEFPEGNLEHWLAPLEDHLVERGASDALLGRAREELAATALRMRLRERVLALAVRTVTLREELARLARGHLTTLLIATSGQQAVQPTSLAHYLLAQIGPLERSSARLRELYGRVNRSPLGAVSGVGTALPLRRDRAAELLGFERVIENTFDALASTDVEREALGVIALQAGELLRLLGDLSYWARDDVGLITPGDEFVHRSGSQPQRRDPGVLQQLAVRFAELERAQVRSGSPFGMLGDEPAHLELGLDVLHVYARAEAALELTSRVVAGLVVERAGSANRAQRGFPTASELADFFVVDHELPYERAFALAELIVAEATTLNMGAMQLTSEFVDRIALRELGVELGIEAETLSRCLAPRRFIERRGDIGGPSPAAVGESLDREALSVRREGTWIDERRAQLRAAQELLAERQAALRTG